MARELSAIVNAHVDPVALRRYIQRNCLDSEGNPWEYCDTARAVDGKTVDFDELPDEIRVAIAQIVLDSDSEHGEHDNGCDESVASSHCFHDNDCSHDGLDDSDALPQSEESSLAQYDGGASNSDSESESGESQSSLESQRSLEQQSWLQYAFSAWSRF